MPVALPPSNAATSGAGTVQTVLAQPAEPRPFSISLYKPNYLIPYYHVSSPDQAVYAGHTPENQTIAQDEVKFQLSLEVPVLTDIGGSRVSLFAAYTQLSYWQAYGRSAFFRESDYEPEAFLEYAWSKPLPGGWRLETVDLGLVHQSNGQGSVLERSWNRVYVGGTFVRRDWTVRIRGWHAIRAAGLLEHNPDISHYLGYGDWVASYRWGAQRFSLMSRNNLTSGFARGAWQLSWSFPLVQHLRGYVQAFSGYGQSLIEYDHSTNAVGVGIAINDW